MHTKLEDWKNGWFGVELGITPDEIDQLIERLATLKTDHDQHFHITSDYKAAGGLGDLMVYVQTSDQASNMERLSGRALAPGEDIDIPNPNQSLA